MFDTSGAGEDGWGMTPPPPAADRLWRHPSELAPAPTIAPTPHRAEHRPHRFSLGTVVVASSLGALAMFGTLAATGLVGGTATTPQAERPSGITGAVTDATASYTTTSPPGVVSVRLSSASTTTFGAGIVFNSSGDVVTTLRATDPSGTPTGTVSVEVGDSAWGEATIVGSDPVTGLTVLHPTATATAPHDAALVRSATVATPSLGQSVDLVRPGLGAIGARFRSGTATRITSTNATIGTSGTSFVGLLTLTSPRPATSAEVGVDSTTGDVTALVVPVDDNPEDEMAYAVPADLAIAIGRQIEATGSARHGTLAADLLQSPTDGLVVTATRSSELAVGDELLSVDGRMVHTNDDVLGALLGVSPGTEVNVVVRRDNRQRSVDADVVARIGDPIATTTTLP